MNPQATPNLLSVARGRPRRSATLLCVSAAAAALVAGCSTLGPRTIPGDRFDYSAAVGDSWKQQTLLNIVKLRYMDLPVFVEVASIVAGYSMETSGSVGAQAFSGGSTGDGFTLGAAGKFTDRPTITYMPMTGEKFLRGLLTPIDPKNIFFMLQSGYAADFLLGLTVDSLNGVRNRSMTGGAVRDADPDFIRALELLREIQAAGAVGMRVEEDKDKASTAVIFFRRDNLPDDVVKKGIEVRRLLKLAPDSQRYVLTYSPVRGPDAELAVSSRSMLQILSAFASYVEVPQEHQTDGSAVPGGEGTTSGRGTVRIHSGQDKPPDAFAAVRYRGHWYWIDDRDWQSKRALTAVMFFFTLTNSGANEQVPLITIPAQ